MSREDFSIGEDYGDNCLCSYSGSDENVVIPEGVKILRGNVFKDNTEIKSVTIPESIECVEPGYLWDDYYYNTNDCDECLREILPDYVFEGCDNLEKIILKNRNIRVKENWAEINVLKNSVHSFYPDQLNIGLKKQMISKVGNLLLSDSTYEEWNKAWLDYLKTAVSYYYDEIAESENLLHVMIKEKYLNLEDVKSLISITSEKSFVENTAVLLDYQNKTFTEKEITEFTKKQLLSVENNEYDVKDLWDYKEQEDGTIIINNYKGNDSKIKVPESIDNKAVTAIGEGVFSPSHGKNITGIQKDIRNEITDITIPDCVVSIGEGAFYNCESLKSLKLSDNIKSIDNLIHDCSALGSFTFPKDVSSFDDNAFLGCENIYTIYLNDKLEDINKTALFKCKNLGAIYGAKNNPNFFVEDCAVYSKDINKDGGFIKFLPRNKDREVGYSLEFPLCDMDSVYTGEITEFIDIKSICYIAFPETMTFLDGEELYFDESYNLSTVLITENIDEITGDPFYNCGGGDFTIIGREGTYAQEFAYETGSSFNDEYLCTFDEDDLKKRKQNVKKWVKSNSCKDGCYYFGNKKKLPLIAECGFSNGITCYDSDSSSEILIPEEIGGIKVDGIYYNAFYGCTDLKKVTIPEGIKSIGSFAFDSCTNLESINIPDSVWEMGNGVFYGCTSLRAVDIPEGVEKIGYGTFYNCENLEKVTIPDSVEEICSFAFEGCDKLTIYGKSGSYAEEYANDNGIDFEAID